MTTPLPALSKTPACRNDIPFPDKTSALNLWRSFAWLWKACRMDQVATGTLVGTRHANSIWTCRYSCNGTVAGAAGDGVDRWGGTFNAANLVCAASGSAHSWIVLRSADGLWEMVFDLNSSTAGTGRIAFARVADGGYTGGTTTSGPTASGEVTVGTTGAGPATSMGSLFIDTAITGAGNTYNFATVDTDEIWEFTTRTGLGKATGVWGWQGFVDSPQASDVRGRVYLQHSTLNASTPPWDADTQAPLTGCVSASRQSWNSSTRVSNGGPLVETGTANAGSYLADANTANYYPYRPKIRDYTPYSCERGYIRDFYFSGGVTGSSEPSVVAQRRLLVGQALIPWSGLPTF